MREAMVPTYWSFWFRKPGAQRLTTGWHQEIVLKECGGDLRSRHILQDEITLDHSLYRCEGHKSCPRRRVAFNPASRAWS